MNTQENKVTNLALYWLPSIIFNIVETILVFSVGILMKISIYEMLYSIIIFQTVRHILKEDKHYKNPFKCLIWTTFAFAAIFLMAKINIVLYTIASAFAAYILSGKADIEKENNSKDKVVGMYLWKRKTEPSKYKFIEDYVEDHKGTAQLSEFDEFLESMDEQYYKIFKLRFYENKSQSYIIQKLDISSTARLTEKLDDIQNILKVYINATQKN